MEQTVGVVANRTKVYDDNMEVVAEYEPKLTANGCDKAAQFVYFVMIFQFLFLHSQMLQDSKHASVRKTWR